MIKKLMSFLFIVLISFAAQADEKESAYDRVMETGTIRCGYITGAPYFMKDAATGEMSGIWYDYIEAMGKALNLKIDWAEEVGFGDFATTLEAGRIDAFCVGFWVNPLRARVMDFVSPISYQLVHAYVREGDDRFDHNLDALNDANMTVSCIDGEMSVIIAQEDFPKAKTVCLPQLAPFSDLYLGVTSGKADVVFSSPSAVEIFNKNNPDKLRPVKADRPLRIFPESIAVARNQYEFKRVLDLTTQFLIDSGKIDRIIDQYAASPDDFQKTAKPYAEAR